MARVIVCGLGQVGFRIANLLVRLGEEVTVVTQGSREEFEELIQEAGAKLVRGDARADKNLLAAGITDADSLIACVDGDLTNIEICLDAIRLNPQCRVVARLFDQELGTRLEESVGIHRTLAMSSLAAPAFATAALGERIRGSYRHKGETFFVVARGTDEDTERLLRAGAHVIEGDPSGSLHCTHAAFLGESKVGVARKVREKERFSPQRLVKLVKVLWATVPRALRTVATVILALSCVSVVVFQIGLHLTPIDAFYFVVATLTTTGYGDISPKDADAWLKLYTCFVMVLGSAAIATLYSIITDFIVSVRFDQIYGRHKATSIEHVIVVGLGNVGYRTVVALRQLGGEVVAVDIDHGTDFRGLLDANTPFIGGDARDADTLELAGIRRATAVVSVTDDDAINLSVGLIAKSLNPQVRTVLRLFDGDLASKIQASVKVDAALSGSKIAAPGFVGAALYPNALFCYTSGDRFIAIVEQGNQVVTTSTLLKPTAVTF